jgi:hypothetical protein
MFTYQHQRDEIKRMIDTNPFSCTYSWVVNWISQEVAKLPPGSNVLEMGTFVGGTTRLLSLSNPLAVIHSIDLNQYDNDNHMLSAMKNAFNLPNLIADDLFEIQKMHVEDCPNIRLYTGDSKSLDLNNISISFIDADHHQDQVLEDLEYAWERTVPNGFIYGDDANEPTVFNAFQIFAREKDIELTLYSKCARIQKTERINPNLRYYAPPDHPVSNDILIVGY